jgi:hypothetical protein
LTRLPTPARAKVDAVLLKWFEDRLALSSGEGARVDRTPVARA